MKNKKEIKLFIPKVEDLWFRAEMLADSETMNYNAGYDVNYVGYHYETGCIDFPKTVWKSWYDEKMKNMFFAYILDCKTNKFVGNCNFKIDKKTGKASMGIVVKNEFRGQGYMRPALKLLLDEAKKQRVKVLEDTIPLTREHALKVFLDFGFEKIKTFEVNKFGKPETVALIEKKL